MKAAVLFWNGEETEVLKELVGELVAWYSGVGTPGDETTNGDEGDEVAEDGADEGDVEDEDADEEDGGDSGDNGDGGDEEPARRERMPKPTPEEISDWAERSDAGESISSIARSCGRSISQVHRALRKRD